ncbi:phosphatase domain-containing protein [Nonomuraea sp. NPDC004186]
MTDAKLWIVDIDGTLALRGDRGPYDWDRVGEDLPNPPVVAIVQALLNDGHRIAYVSGRKERCRRQTERWLARHVGGEAEGVWMRGDRDNRSDTVVKREIYKEHFADREVFGVIDDRASVVAMWRSLGLTVVQVAEGRF